MATTVVNVRSYPMIAGRRVLPEGVIYIGRAVARVGLPKSRWANPYRVGDEYTDWSGWTSAIVEGEPIRLYRGWLNGRLHDDPTFLDPLRGMALACWCAPKPCHGDVIVDWIEAHPLVPQAGEQIVFGLHRQAEPDAETAPAWPSRRAFAARFDERHRRAMRKAMAS